MQNETSEKVDLATVRDFGREWQTLTPAPALPSDEDRARMFRCYFDLFP